MKFKDGYMISSGQPVKDYIDFGVQINFSSWIQVGFNQATDVVIYINLKN